MLPNSFFITIEITMCHFRIFLTISFRASVDLERRFCRLMFRSFFACDISFCLVLSSYDNNVFFLIIGEQNFTISFIHCPIEFMPQRVIVARFSWSIEKSSFDESSFFGLIHRERRFHWPICKWYKFFIWNVLAKQLLSILAKLLLDSSGEGATVIFSVLYFFWSSFCLQLFKCQDKCI